MDSEDDAKDTLLDLRLKKRMFRGQSVKGRLKSETVVRSFYPVQAAPSMPPAIYPGMQMQYSGGFVQGPMPIDMRYNGYNMGQIGGMMAPMGHNGVMMTQQPVMDMSQHMIPTPPSSSHEDVETKTESSSQNSKDRRTPYVPVTSGGAAVSGSLTQGSSSASSYKGAATSGSTGGSSMSSRDGASRDRSVKVMMLTQSCITDVLRIIYTLPCSIMFVCSNSLISLPLFRQFFFCALYSSLYSIERDSIRFATKR